MEQALYLVNLLKDAEDGSADACLALATGWWQGQSGLVPDSRLANLYLNRYYASKCNRIYQIGCQSPPESALQQMLDNAFQTNRTSDCVIPHAYCWSCSDGNEQAVCIFTGESSCGTAEDLVGYGIRCAENVCKNYLPPCTECGASTTTAVVDFLTPRFHEEDFLVIRVLLSESLDACDFGVLWWRKSEGLEDMPEELPDETEKCFLTLERAARLMAAGLEDLAVALIEYAFVRFEADPVLVHAVTLLADRRFTQLAESIARSHIKHFPADSLGHMYLAEVLLRGKAFDDRGKLDPSAVSGALHRVSESLRLRPGWKDALLMQCILLSLSDKSTDVVVNSYRKLLRNHPDYGPAHFDFALYCKQIMPDMAARHFAIAGQLIPGLFAAPAECVTLAKSSDELHSTGYGSQLSTDEAVL